MKRLFRKLIKIKKIWIFTALAFIAVASSLIFAPQVLNLSAGCYGMPYRLASILDILGINSAFATHNCTRITAFYCDASNQPHHKISWPFAPQAQYEPTEGTTIILTPTYTLSWTYWASDADYKAGLPGTPNNMTIGASGFGTSADGSIVCTPGGLGIECDGKGTAGIHVEWTITAQWGGPFHDIYLTGDPVVSMPTCIGTVEVRDLISTTTQDVDWRVTGTTVFGSPPSSETVTLTGTGNRLFTNQKSGDYTFTPTRWPQFFSCQTGGPSGGPPDQQTLSVISGNTAVSFGWRCQPIFPGPTLSASPNPISRNDTTVLSASCSNASSYSLSGGPDTWSGACAGTCSGNFTTSSLADSTIYTLTCTNLNGARQAPVTVTVQATGANRILSVQVLGSGDGTVTASPSGINCKKGGSPDCFENYARGTVVTVTETPDAGSAFAGWGGDCSGAGMNLSCTLTLDADKSVTATFNTTGGGTHLDCVSGTCQVVAGAGADLCSPAGSVCGGPVTHLECVSETCTSVAGAGADTCSPVGSFCGGGGHLECDTGPGGSGYCIRVAGAGSDNCAPEGSFTSCGSPPGAFSLGFNNLTCNSVRLGWSDSHWAFSYDLLRDGVQTVPSMPSSQTSFTDLSLSQSTTYRYKIKASNPLGQTWATANPILDPVNPGDLIITTPTCPVCGNGVREGSEQCDLGVAGNGACPKTCSATCTINACTVCGNGVLDPGEECDDGNGNNGDGCDSTCQVEEAGAVELPGWREIPPRQ